MTTYIFKAGKCIGQSHDLRGMLDYARRAGGVQALDVIHISESADERRPGAFIRAQYTNGATAETYFSDAAHCEQWARKQSNASPRRSWFAGCAVYVQTREPGEWDWNRTPGDPIMPPAPQPAPSLRALNARAIEALHHGEL